MAVHYYPFINKVVTQLKLRDKARHSQPDQHLSAGSFIKPFITVAREPGSGGAPIAKRVAEKIGFELIDKQIIAEIAKSTRKRKSVIRAVDEKHRTAIQDIVHSVLNKEYVNDMRYMKELVKVVLAYAHQGRVVILGRGANFITPFAKGLHVHVTAPYRIRVQRAMDYEGHSREKARQVIKEVEQQRRSFVKQYLTHDVDKKNAYDLVLNTTYFSVDEAAEVIVHAFRKKFSKLTRLASTLLPK